MNLTNKKDTKQPIDLDKSVYKKMAETFSEEFKATPGRKRPRNPQEKETLLRWQEKRGGTKIGEI